MSLDNVFGQVPDPQSYSFPDYSLPQGDPVKPIALTDDELTALLDLYDAFSAVDPTGMDSNPFLRATSEFLQQTLGAPLTRPDEQLNDDIAGLLNDFSDDLGGQSMAGRRRDAGPPPDAVLFPDKLQSVPHSSAPAVRPRPGRRRDAVCRVRTRHRAGVLPQAAEKRSRVTASVRPADAPVRLSGSEVNCRQ